MEVHSTTMSGLSPIFQSYPAVVATSQNKMLKMLPFFIFLVLFPIIGQATSVVKTVTVHQPANFSCVVESVESSLWLFDGNYIIQGSRVYKTEKYRLIVTSENDITMEILNVTEEDEGTYICQDGGRDKTRGQLKVEISPMVHLEMNEVILKNITDVVFLEEVPIKCVAKRGKPSVSLSWLVNGKSKTSGVTTDLSQEQDRIINSTLHYIPNKVDTNVTCVTSGQKTVPSVSVNVGVNVRYKPDCTLLVTNKTTNQFKLSCKCSANPEASEYKIFVNGSLYREQTEVLISSNDTSVVACSASNILGEDKTEEQTLEPFHVAQPPSTARVALAVAIPAGIICVIILVILAVVFVRARKGKKHNKDTEQSLNAVRSITPPPEDDEGDTQETTPMQSSKIKGEELKSS